MKTVTVTTPDGEKYELAPIRTGQMRGLSEFRLQNPNASFIDDNILCLVHCLNNAVKEDKDKVWTKERVEDLPYPVYKQLLDVTSELNGFETKKPGEVEATASTSLNGIGSTVALPPPLATRLSK